MTPSKPQVLDMPPRVTRLILGAYGVATAALAGVAYCLAH